MKNEHVTVILRFSRKRNPEWFEYLSSIGDGRIRSAAVRAHLEKPGSRMKIIVPPQSAEAAPAAMPEPAENPPVENAAESANAPPASPAAPVPTGGAGVLGSLAREDF
jgi:hypothetical protein